jgi:hypothetical protein
MVTYWDKKEYLIDLRVFFYSLVGGESPYVDIFFTGNTIINFQDNNPISGSGTVMTELKSPETFFTTYKDNPRKSEGNGFFIFVKTKNQSIDVDNTRVVLPGSGMNNIPCKLLRLCNGCSQYIVFECLKDNKYSICRKDMQDYVRLYFYSPNPGVTPYIDIYFNSYGNILSVEPKEFNSADAGRVQITVPTSNPNNNIISYYEDNPGISGYDKKIRFNIYLNNREVDVNKTTAENVGSSGGSPASSLNLKITTRHSKNLKTPNYDSHYDKYKIAHTKK